MQNIYMKMFKLIMPMLIIVASLFLFQKIISNSISNQAIKLDYAELNHIKYGLLNIEEWKLQITEILVSEIGELELSKENERVLKKHVEVLLNTLIDDVDKKVRANNATSPGGVITQSLINIFIDLDDIKKGIPEYADAVILEMTNSKAKRHIKVALKKELEAYANLTFDEQDMSQLDSILFKTHTSNIAEARIKISDDLSANHGLIIKQVNLLIMLSIILFAWYGLSKKPLLPFEYIALVLALIMLLVAGVSTPMIDMEATISQISFMLMGHHIHFENQVLYFQSKSILDVFWIMITHQDIPMKLVGVLLVTFSLIFPILKLASSLGYYFNYLQARNNRAVEFLVFKSGKWSMADVMVVAIFMAYIGFNGIITSQLGKLSTADEELVVLTTNGTSLQPGFYLFLIYTLLALVLPGMLARKPIASA